MEHFHQVFDEWGTRTVTRLGNVEMATPPRKPQRYHHVSQKINVHAVHIAIPGMNNGDKHFA